MIDLTGIDYLFSLTLLTIVRRRQRILIAVIRKLLIELERAACNTILDVDELFVYTTKIGFVPFGTRFKVGR